MRTAWSLHLFGTCRKYEPDNIDYDVTESYDILSLSMVRAIWSIMVPSSVLADASKSLHSEVPLCVDLDMKNGHHSTLIEANEGSKPVHPFRQSL
jgi:hypothetical protein